MGESFPQLLKSGAIALSVLLPASFGDAPAALAADGAVPFEAPGDGGPRRLEVVGGDADVHESPGPDAGRSGVLAEGEILENLGCAAVSGGVWCEVRPFRGGAKGHVPGGRLRPAKGPDGTVPTGPDDSRKRARRKDFDATAEIPCAQELEQGLSTCEAGVARAGGGDATVAVTFSTGFTRRLFFVNGEFIAGSGTMSGAGRDMDWRLEGGTHHIRVDTQSFVLTDAFVFGG